MFANFSAIVAGAAFGALLRYAFGLWFAGTASWFAFGTLAANWTGAYLIGLIAALLDCFPALSPNWRLLLITGFLGSLTTFSGFSLEIIGMLQAQRWGAVLAVVLLHLLGSLLLAALGLATVQLFR
ncbi:MULTISPECIES: fluoride efflux transporter CrcB [unclassified Neisseria]|uniref:fluoride efflux transporter CrcB n=1 Tax=unclassified Neisseria TaxID=2623750 RepID=UPI0010717411|nr:MULTISPECIES: fluoride efflux transporter CrcB [unclassified Neisseria]MBF0802792.1 fluoride efflux transporter CrcB [Neisseria sp. 19428wB4_WF04]TFU44588.1 fluoride efflux transporter CrcB [Neisseria sp. WF04]